MSKGKILVTPRSLSKNGHPYLKKLENAGYEVLTPFPGKQPDEDELLSVLPDCVGYLAGVEKVSAGILNRCPRLKIISRNGVGIDNVDREAAEKLGISLRIAAGANSRGVAELAIALMLSLLRLIPQTAQSVKTGTWDRIKGAEAEEKTLGIIGTGQIGRYVAGMAAGLDMNIIGYDPYPDKDLPKRVKAFRYAGLDEVLSESDIISLHCPAGDKPLIDAEAVEKLKRGCRIVNTARAALVEQGPLLRALEDGRVAGYAVDAFESEPPELTPLLLHPGVILTAHIGGFTAESVDRATEAAVKNILSALE